MSSNETFQQNEGYWEPLLEENRNAFFFLFFQTLSENKKLPLHDVTKVFFRFAHK